MATAKVVFVPLTQNSFSHILNNGGVTPQSAMHYGICASSEYNNLEHCYKRLQFVTKEGRLQRVKMRKAIFIRKT